MNKTTKGSLAAGAAAVLLLGGAGSLAYWTDSAIVNGGSVNSGYMTLTKDPVSTTQDCTSFVYAGAVKTGGAVTNFVPGDVVSTTCSFIIAAKGDNLSATPTIPNTVTITPTASAASFQATVAATYTLAGTTYSATTPITQANDTNKLVATIKVTIPYGTDQKVTPIVNGNDTQRINAALGALTVSLVQNNPNA